MTLWKLKSSDLKRYPHFDQILKPEEIAALVPNPVRVAENSFFPLLRYNKGWQPFRPGSESKKTRPKPRIGLSVMLRGEMHTSLHTIDTC